jgi:type IV pilus assembly protein PilB
MPPKPQTPTGLSSKIGNLLLKADIITKEQLNEAIEKQKQEKCRLDQAFVRLGYLTENDLTEFISMHYEVPAFDFSEWRVDKELLKVVPADLVKKFVVFPVKREGSTLTIATTDPTNLFAIDSIRFRTNYNVIAVVANFSSIVEKIQKYYAQKQEGPTAQDKAATAAAANEILSVKDYVSQDEAEEDEEGGAAPTVDVQEFDTIVGSALDNIEVSEEDDGDLSDDIVDAPIVKLVNGILLNALKVNASDIHIEPFEKNLRVRYRIDGVAQVVMNLPPKIKAAMASRLKIMSRLDIAEKRIPQDGRIKLKLSKKKDIEYRVSVLPCLFGEKIVLRLLDKSNLQLDLTKLGFDQGPLDDFMDAINAPYGMILVTGPTGSGKTTTLYSALSTINTPDVNIMTAEDPVEFNLMGINQVLVRDNVGLTFAAALKSFLRQDPDIIMIGEIRDYETGEIGIKAALTGHLVFSTLHTNDAPSTIQRLLNMGIEPFLVSASVLLIVAQRLARRICVKCKAETQVPLETLLKAGFTEEEAKTLKPMKGKGCSACSNGYKGRVALYEVMKINDALKEAILRRAPATELKRVAIDNGFQTLRMSGLKKVKEGMTTIEEVFRCTVADSS